MKQEIAHNICKNIAEHSANKARNTKGWQQWLLAIVAALAGAIAWFTQEAEPAKEENINPCAPPSTQAPTPSPCEAADKEIDSVSYL